MTTAHSFRIGHHAFQPDVRINFQLNRFCDGSPTFVTELTEVAPRTTDYADYTSELLALSQVAHAAGRALAGGLCQRSAEFYMLPDDPRKDGARLALIESICASSGWIRRAGNTSLTSTATSARTGSPRTTTRAPS